MSARTQLQSKPVADLRAIAEGLGLEFTRPTKSKAYRSSIRARGHSC